MKLNLKMKFLIPILGVAIVGMTVLTLVSFNASKNALQGNIRHQMTQTSQALALQINDWVEDHQRDITILAQSADLLAAFDSPAESRGHEILSNVFSSYGSYEFLALVNESGRVVVASNDDLVGLDLSSRDYVRQSLKGQAVLSEVLVSKASGNPVFSIAVPMKEQGKTVGVLVAVVDMSSFSDAFIHPVKAGENGYAYVIDEKGRFIAYPDNTKLISGGIAEYD